MTANSSSTSLTNTRSIGVDMARLILRRQLSPALPEKPKPLTFKDLKVGEVFRRIVGPDKVAMICTKTSNRKASHRLGETAFDDNTKVERCVVPDGHARFMALRIGDEFTFVSNRWGSHVYMKLSPDSAEAEEGYAEGVPFHEPVVFLKHALD